MKKKREIKDIALKKITYHMSKDDTEFLSNEYFEENEIDKDMEDSSIPLEGMAEQTAGMQPRSRIPVSRESQSRRKAELLSRFTEDYSRQFKGRLHIDKEDVPEGYSIFWGAKSVKGHGRQERLTRLYEDGFFPATAEDFPRRAYRDYYGELDDSMDVIDCGANTLLLSDNDLNNAHLRHYEKVSYHNSAPVREAEKLAQDPYNTRNKSQGNDRFFPNAPDDTGLNTSYFG